MQGGGRGESLEIIIRYNRKRILFRQGKVIIVEAIFYKVVFFFFFARLLGRRFLQRLRFLLYAMFTVTRNETFDDLGRTNHSCFISLLLSSPALGNVEYFFDKPRCFNFPFFLKISLRSTRVICTR